MIRLGTRGSALALAQSQRVADSIAARTGEDVELVRITTHGDVSSEPLASMGGAGVFVTAVRESLLAEECDLVVHSLKDLPTAPHPGLLIAATPKRADPRDAAVVRDGIALADLPAGSRVGTGSPRRQAQLRRRFPEIDVVELRGNVDTRLGRVLGREAAPASDGKPAVEAMTADLDAVILAAAGLERLDRTDVITEYLGIDGWPTAPGQGALAIETRRDLSGALKKALLALDHHSTRVAVDAERAVLRRLEAGCSAPLGAHAFIDDSMMFLGARVYSPEGEQVSSAHALYVDDADDPAEELAARVADDLLENGAAELARVGGDR
jgi:hydroxymethylbilane synthase